MNTQKLKAKDLRIGNYIVFNTNDNPFQITPAGLLELSQIEGKPNPYFYEPIIVTEDWLIKLGFTKDTESNCRWFLLDGALSYDIDDFCVRISDSWEFGKRKYVHELQNLIHSLTLSDAGVLS